MDKLTQLWTWLNGKKTVIGTVLFLLAMLIRDVVGGIWNVDGAWLSPTITTLEYVSALFGVSGLTHRFVKNTK